MSDPKPKLDSIFEAAAKILSADKRAAFLARECGDDIALRHQIEELLESDRIAGSFLEKAPPGLAGHQASDSSGQHHAAPGGADVTSAMMVDALSAPADQDHGAHHPGAQHDSVLGNLGMTLDSVPRVALRDELEGADPVVRPNSDEIPKSASGSRYHLDGEIARGGMGAVLKGRDTDLGRDLAIKVLLDAHKDNPQVIQRFVEEAQIGGQLQHPGIVPVYELGQFIDKRPFFSMKLVKGATLSKLLSDRKNPQEERSRFLGIFEQICQTMAYAHSRGVIHRDLKPSNIMVGAFGEVQVMDWGLAKVLQTGGIEDETQAHNKNKDISVIQTLRSSTSETPVKFGSNTQVGSVMGTPAYMSPEQALGEIGSVDERSDVFGLGAILCEILTGQPPYVSDDTNEVYRMATRGLLGDCFERLAESDADSEIVEIAKSCLAQNSYDRPRDARQVADSVSSYLESVESRLRKAELAKVEAETRSIEEQRRRKLQVGLAMFVLLTVIAGGAIAFRIWQQDRTRQEALQKSLARIETLQGQVREDPTNMKTWQDAIVTTQEAINAYQLLGDREGVDALEEQLSTLQSGFRAARVDEDLLNKLMDIRSTHPDDLSGRNAEQAFQQAFTKAGIEIEARSPADIAAQISQRPAKIVVDLAVAFDDWSRVRRQKLLDSEGAKKLTQIAQLLDPDPWRNMLRQTLSISDKKLQLDALRSLRQSADLETVPAISLDLLGRGLADAGDLDASEEVLRQAYRKNPSHVLVAHDLGLTLLRKYNQADAIRYLMVAYALRPETGHELAHALIKSGRREEGLAIFRELVRMRPTDGRHLACLGNELHDHEQEEAAELLQSAVERTEAVLQENPDDYSTYSTLYTALNAMGKSDEARQAIEKSIELNPQFGMGYRNLAQVLMDQAQYQKAIEPLEKSIELEPFEVDGYLKLASCRHELGDLSGMMDACNKALEINPDNSMVYHYLAWGLLRQSKPDEALEAIDKAIEIDPLEATHQARRAAIVQARGDIRGALEAAQKAVELNDSISLTLTALGGAYSRMEDFQRSLTAYQKCVEVAPKEAMSFNNLGAVEFNLGRYADAERSSRRCIELDPGLEGPYRNLARVFRATGRDQDALKSLDEGIEVAREPILIFIEKARILLELDRIEESDAVLETALKVAETQGEIQRIEVLAQQADIYRLRGKVSEAETIFRQCLEEQPLKAWFYRGLASTLQKAGRFSDADEVLRDAINRFPDDAETHLALGQALLNQQDEKAIASLQQAATLNPRYRIEFAQALARWGRNDEALNVSEEIVRDGLAKYTTYALQGQVLRQMGRSGDSAKAMMKAIEVARKAVEDNPNSATAHEELGKASMLLGQNWLAIPEFKAALKLRPNDPNLLTHLGGTLSNAGQMDEAVVKLEKAIELLPTFGLPWEYLGITLMKMGKLEESVEAYKRRASIAPDGPTYVQISFLLFQLGRLDEGREYIAKAIESDPENVQLLFQVGTNLMNVGDSKEAIHYLQRALLLNPLHQEALFQLALALRSQGRYQDALPCFQRSRELGSLKPNWTDVPQTFVDQFEIGAQLENDFNEYLNAEKAFPSALHRSMFGEVCYSRGMYAEALAFYPQPEGGKQYSIEDIGFLYNRACAAALAAADEGTGKPLSVEEKAALRKDVLDSLTVCLDYYRAQLDDPAGEVDAPTTNRMVSHWLDDRDLTSVREPDQLSQLPQSERDSFDELWEDVRALIKKSASH